MILVGEPDTKYMWILSRSQQPQPEVVQEYLDYAESIGYDLSDVIKTKTDSKVIFIMNHLKHGLDVHAFFMSQH